MVTSVLENGKNVGEMKMSDYSAKGFFAGLLPKELRTKEAEHFEELYKLATALRLALAKVAIPNPYRRFSYPYHAEHDEMLADLAAFAFKYLQEALSDIAKRAGVEVSEELPKSPDIARYEKRKHAVLLAEEQSMRIGYGDGYLHGFDDFYACLEAGMEPMDVLGELNRFHDEVCAWEENQHERIDLIEANMKGRGDYPVPSYEEHYLKRGRRIQEKRVTP